MKRIIREIVNWAYGLDLEMEFLILNQAKRNLASTLSDSMAMTSMEIGRIRQEMNANQKSSQK